MKPSRAKRDNYIHAVQRLAEAIITRYLPELQRLAEIYQK